MAQHAFRRKYRTATYCPAFKGKRVRWKLAGKFAPENDPTAGRNRRCPECANWNWRLPWALEDRVSGDVWYQTAGDVVPNLSEHGQISDAKCKANVTAARRSSVSRFGGRVTQKIIHLLCLSRRGFGGMAK